MHEKKLSRREREREFRKREIMQAAEALFAEKGFEHTTLDEIAVASEFGKGTIYNYFENKEELYHTILHCAFSNNLDMVMKDDESSETFVEFISKHTRNVVHFYNKNRFLFHLMVREYAHAELTGFNIDTSDIENIKTDIRKIILSRFKQAAESNMIKYQDSEKLFFVFIHVVYSYIYSMINRFGGRELDLEEEADFILEIFLNGIMKKQNTEF